MTYDPQEKWWHGLLFAFIVVPLLVLPLVIVDLFFV